MVAVDSCTQIFAYHDRGTSTRRTISVTYGWKWGHHREEVAPTVYRWIVRASRTFSLKERVSISMSNAKQLVVLTVVGHKKSPAAFLQGLLRRDAAGALNWPVLPPQAVQWNR